jgi:hypothetical protein
MKKLIYIALITFSTALSLSSCTEEPVTPATDLNGGAGTTDDKKP